MLDDHDRASNLSVLNRHAKTLPGPRRLHHLVPKSSDAHAPAIDFLEHGSTRRTLSYETLHAASDHLADRIRESLAGLEGASAIVPVLLPQSPELYIALLAILKAGKAFCPVGLGTPPDRFQFILRDIKANIIITDSTRRDQVPASADITALLVDRHVSVTGADHRSKRISQEATSLAYVLYTSGSTGVPKAVSVSHHAVTQSLLAHDRHIPAFDRFLQFAAPTFDVSIFEIFFPLFRGRTIVSCTRAEMLNDLPGTIVSMDVDAAELTPTVVSNLLRGRESVPCLKLLLTIGEMLTRDVVEEFGGDETQPSLLWGMYGPTEAAIHCTLQPNFQRRFSTSNIGFPLDTVIALIAAPLTEEASGPGIEVLPIGQIGELVIGGPQVADEYLNREELTSKAFILDDTFGYLYRTGDKARVKPDGTLECLGRISSGQVKLRGQRVELGEIEHAILKTEDFYGAVALVIEDVLVAFCATSSANIAEATVVEACKKWLPEYMVPTEIKILRRIPLLPSGKADKKALELQYLEHRQTSSPTQLTGNEIDGFIPSVLQAVLGRKIENTDDLMTVGLDSLRSIRIASSLRREGYQVGPVDILSARTLQELVSLCESRKDHNVGPVADIQIGLDDNDVLDVAELRDMRSNIADVLPCTPLQQAMLTETTTRPSAYCNWIEVELLASRTFTQIVGMLEELIQHNEILRSGFCIANTGAEPFVQIVWKKFDPAMIKRVSDFSRAFSLGSMESLLRPFSVQVNATLAYPRLLFQIHHSLYDGWSFDLLLRDLNELMADKGLAARPQFREVVKYNLGLTASDQLNKSKEYWVNLLRDYRPDPLPNFNGKIIPFTTLRSIQGQSSVTTSSLSQIANEQGVHPQVFFQVAVSLLIGAYLGTHDVVIGTVTSGRTIPVTHVEDIVGPCIASLPFRSNCSNDCSVTDVLRSTHQANRDMLAHSTVTLRDIARLCNLRPGQRHFDVLFIWQETLLSYATQDMSVRTVDAADDQEFKLLIEFEPRGDRIQYRITYDPSIIPERQAWYLSRQIDQVVSRSISDVDAKIEQIMGALDTNTLSVANPTPTLSVFDHGPSQPVEKWAAEAPQKDALIFGNIVNGAMCIKEKLTYASLNLRANQLASLLRDRGVEKGQLVCVLMEKSIDLYVSILAVLKLGCAYLPIVPDAPKSRIEAILEDARVSACICHTQSVQSLPVHQPMVFNLDELDYSKYPQENLNVVYNGSDLAYAVFTSGSTGKPKGVLVTQDNLMSNLEYLSSLYPTAYDSKLLQSCSQAFDVSVFEIFFSWYTGICLCTATKDDLFFDFEAAINELEITHLSLTPTVAGMVDPGRVPKVKFLVTAGEALTESVRRRWAGNGLYQGYGPSETTNICTIKPHVALEDSINNIGQPLPSTSAVLLVPGTTNIVPRGAVGELCFGGAQVFQGYLNRPDLNSEKILEFPEYGRIYRSGDMGRLLPDDSILFTGRMDDQVKIRGQRVELGEINSTTLDHPAVHDSTTVIFSRTTDHQELLTFVVLQGTQSTEFKICRPEEYRQTILDIFESLSLKLPAYMIPTHVIPISCIPITHQTKIDTRSLRDAFLALSDEGLQLVCNSQGESTGGEFSETESTIAHTLSTVLSIPVNAIARNSSFFSLGLDSVSAIRFAKSLRNAGLESASVSVILKSASVLRLASVLEKDPGSQRAESGKRERNLSDVFTSQQLSDIQSLYSAHGLVVDKVLPCTPLQEAMLSKRDSAGDSYYNISTFTVHGDLDRLMQCWGEMVKRHEILRTSFIPTNHQQYAFAQVVLQDQNVQWLKLDPNEDLPTYASSALSKQLESHRPPLQLATQCQGNSTRLVFCCHHALYDGVAIANLLEEIQHEYKGVKLPPPVSYEVYLQHMVSQDLEAADRFWSAALSNFEPKFFPNLSNKKTVSTQRAHIKTTLDTKLSKALGHCHSTSISLLSLVQAAWAKLLHYALGENDICFGNVVSGRSLPEDDLDRLVAPCFNTLPLRLSFDFDKSHSELCSHLHSANVEAIPFQLTPLRRIQAKAMRSAQHLFDTLVILQQPGTSLEASIWSAEQDVGEMDVPIACEVTQNSDSDALLLTLHYESDRLQDGDAQVLAEIFDNAFQSIIKFPGSPANDTLGFSSHLLGQDNVAAQGANTQGADLLHAGFVNNAIRQPDSIALSFRHKNGHIEDFTYKRLNEMANRIANALVQSGAQPEDVVPVHMVKSPEFYASILGVLKAGAAFTPIHPTIPTSRKRYVLSELQPKIVLSMEDDLDWVEQSSVLNVTKLQDFPVHNPEVQNLQSTNLAYCLYTSGSTGVPKAVSMEHQSPIQTIESSRSLVPWNQNSKLLQYAAVTFDMCYYDCFIAWTFGFTLCSAEQEQLLDNLVENINHLGADLLDLTPSVARLLHRADVPNVKWLYCIGEAMTPDIVQEWDGVCVNSYGPTEAAFCTTIFPTTPDVKASIVGRPFPSTSFAVFPPKGSRPVPKLGIGELYIGGAQLARGYYGRRELTDQRFVHISGQRFYKTGDMVRMLSDSNFEFLGRADDQVKIRGLRVELGEISKTIQDCNESVIDVATQILKKQDGEKEQLVAFMVTRHSPDSEALSALKQKAMQRAIDNLPAYMVPQFILCLDKIPRSMAGKVDKNALATIFRESDEVNSSGDDTAQTAATHNWTKNEVIIREVFSKFSATSTEHIAPWTTIYQLGLDSISAVQIAAALRKQGFEITTADVLKRMTCADLAAYLDTAQTSHSNLVKVNDFDFETFDKEHRPEIARACGVPIECIDAIRPCTPLQNGMLSQFVAKDGSVYFNYLRLRLDSDTDLDRLNEAWLEVARKHSILRTGFAHIKDKKIPFAMIRHKADAQGVSWQSLSDVLESVEDWLKRSELETVKNLHQPPWRARVVRAGGDSYLDLALLHAIFDAQSLRHIFEDVARVYRGEEIQEPASTDAILEKILHSSSPDDVEAQKFWKGLGEKAVSTRFPSLAPLRHPSGPPEVHTRFASQTIEELDAACRTSNISLQAAGLASWASLLAAYVGESSVTFGVVLSGRTFDGADTAVFPCLTTVPFVCQVSEDKSKLLGNLMQLSADVQLHQFTPGNEIQRLMNRSNEVLYDSIFALQKLSDNDTSDELWTVVDERASVEYPLSIELEPKSGRLEFRLTCLPHIIPKEHATLILDQLDHLLQYYTSPGADLGTSDKHLYSVTPAKEPVISSEARLLHEFVELTASKCPDRVALEFVSSLRDDAIKSTRWTYSELERESNKVANVLIFNNIRPGELVGICFDKCPEAYFAILGIMKAGAAFVALDPGAPVARKTFILQDSGAKVLLSMQNQTSALKEDVSAKILNLDEIDWRSASSERPHLRRDVQPQDLSYCLYTSGTTGTPKGCEITHENAVQAMMAFKHLFTGHWDNSSRWFQFASFHFDVSVLEQFWSWSVGICVVSAPRDLIFEDLPKSLKTLDITHIDLTPSLARILSPDEVPSLCKGVFITGGESLKQEILDVWGPKGVIYNGYGPTEATIGVTMYPRVPANGKPSNIGPQFLNVGSYVLRPGTDVPVLRGAVGELCVSGKLVGKGYLNRPDLSKERFPTLKHFEERVYRTGDLVRILHDGTFDFLGRADDQVKLRGQRLEIGEINSVIKKSDTSIADVATLILKHPQQQKEQLVSFIVAGSQISGEPKIMLEKSDDLRKAKDACLDRLPPYMVPTHFVALSNMPLSANNKAEARKLKEMYEALSIKDMQMLSSSATASENEWTEQEKQIQNILGETLDISNVADISKDASFFELGMDSISVIGVSRALKKIGFAKATASAIMKNASIRRLTKYLASQSASTNEKGSVIAAQQAISAVQHRHRRAVAEIMYMDARNIESLAPCTALQEGMIARFMDSKNGLYFNNFQFEVKRDVQISRLQSAWETAFTSSPILRTIFVNTEEGFVQAVLRRAHLKFEHVKLDSPDQIGECLARLNNHWVKFNRTHLKRPIELILVESPEKTMLVLHIFHGLYDGNSIGLIFKTVWDAYNGAEIETGPSFYSALPYGPMRRVDGAKGFWESHLSGKSFNRFPALGDSSNTGPVVVGREVHNLGQLEAARRKLNVTAQAIAQACWVSVLCNYMKGATTIGMVVSGRSIDVENADKIIGPLFNTIPFHFGGKRQETWRSIIARVHDFNVAALPYQHTPLRNIMKWCKRGPDQPLFDTLFVFQVAGSEEAWLDNDAWRLMDSKTEADYPLALEVEQARDGGLKITLVAQGHVLNTETSRKLLDQYEEALRTALVDHETAVERPFVDNSEAEGGTAQDVTPENSGTGLVDSNFKWNANATLIREEVARLSGVEVEEINPNTSIFEVGLDSIDAIRLSSKLKKQSIDLPVSTIMRSLTIANMLKHISAERKRTDARPSDMIFKSIKRRLESYLKRRALTEGVESVLPLTPLQEAMVAEMVASDYTRYYNHDVMVVNAYVDIEKLRSAWMEVVKKSPILRTSFVQVDDPSIESSYAQAVRGQPHAFWSSVEMDNTPNFREVFEQIRNEALSGKADEPLFRVRVVRAPQQTYLILSIAHALYDGWSLGLLHSDVHKAYSGLYKKRPSYEPALHEMLTTSGPDAAAFWRDYLTNATPNLFPRSNTSDPSRSQTVHRKEQGSQLSLSDLNAFAKKYNITLQTLGQTAHAVTVAAYTKSLDVTFGSVLSGRDDEQKSKLMFPTMNTVAIRSVLHGTRQELLQYMQENFADIKQWQHFPLRKAMSLAGANGSLFESLFIYQKSMEEGQSGGDSLYESVQGQSDVEYPVCVEMEVVGGKLIWRCAVKEEVFDEGGAGELLRKLDAVLRAIVEQPGSTTIEFSNEGTSICGFAPFREDSSHEHSVDGTESEKMKSTGVDSETARTIREILAFVSNTPEYEITEDMTIFHLGLDSISAIKVSSLLRKRGVVISVGEMLKAGTVGRMASVVGSRASESEKKEEDAEAVLKNALSHLDISSILKERGVEEEQMERVLPVTAGQTYMLSAWLNSNGQMFYPEFSYRIEGSVSFEKLQDAWRDLVSNNALLRKQFCSTGDSTVPYIQATMRTCKTAIIDVTGWDDKMASQATSEATSKQPYAHAFVWKNPRGWDFKLKIHHALYDGVSLPILIQQLQQLCNGSSISSTDMLSRFIATTAGPSQSEQRKNFWKSYLKDMGAQQHQFHQPGATPESRIQAFKPSLLTSMSTLSSKARKHGLTTQSLVVAAYAKLYAKHTHTEPTEDVVVGLYLANRSFPVPNLSQSAIPTVNLVPLRVSVPLTTDIIDMAAQIQYDIQEISVPAHASASLWEIYMWTGVRVDSFVNFLKLPGEGEDAGSSENDDTGRVRFVQESAWESDVAGVVASDKDAGKGRAEKVLSTPLVNERVNEAYLHAVDVEVTVNDGSMSLGVFAPEEMLELEEAEGLVEGIKGELEGFVRVEV